jgi:polyhydroxybutyrate depolymerase
VLRRLLALLVLAGVTAVVAPQASAGQGIAATIPVPYAGQLRTVNVYVAPRVPTQTAVPLLIVLHGLYNDPAAVEAASGLDGVADTEDVALAYPAGFNGSWNAGNCCGDSHAQGIDDVGFLVQVVGVVSQLRKIDLSRVYITGFSNGGMMALRALCDRPDVFAAAVSVAGTLQTPCADARPVSAMMLHGLADTTVPYNGVRLSAFLGVPITSVPASAAHLAARSRCVANRVSSAARYTRRAFMGCAAGTSVQLLSVPRMGHRWPTVEHDGVDGGALTWTFLKAQRLALT